MAKITKSILVSIDYEIDPLKPNGVANPDEVIMLIGEKHFRKSVEVINVIKGKEAIDIYKKLIGKEGDLKNG